MRLRVNKPCELYLDPFKNNCFKCCSGDRKLIRMVESMVQLCNSIWDELNNYKYPHLVISYIPSKPHCYPQVDSKKCDFPIIVACMHVTHAT